MRPVLQDLLDETATLEPKGRWTTTVVYWQDGTMQITTKHGIVGSRPYMQLHVATLGPISDETIRTQFQKVRERRFDYKRDLILPTLVIGWAKRIQAWGVKKALLNEEETDILAALERIAEATRER